MNRKIIVDSGTDANNQLLNNNLIAFAPFNLEIDGEHFIDTLDLDKEAYLKKMEASKTTPKTAAPSPEYFYNVFKEVDEAFAITISGKLSGSYNSAMSAKNMVLDDFKDKLVHIFDSKTASAGETLIALKLSEFIESGLDFDTIVEKTTHFIDNMKTYFFLQNFDNLVKTGRTNQYIATIAKLLNIAIIGTATEGEIELLEKVRGQKKAIAKLAKIVSDSKVDFSEKILSISHVDSLETATELKKLVESAVNFKDIIIQETSGLCTNYAARSGLVIAF